MVNIALKALSEIRNMAMESTRQPNDKWSTVYHIAQNALDVLDPTEIESVTGIEPRCDICGKAQQPDDDWNGDTGCHINCEIFMASSASNEW